MNFLIDNWMLVMMAATSGGLLIWPLVQGGRSGGGIGTGEAVRLINRERGVLVDVSEPADYAAGHAGGARNVPLAQITAEGAKGLPTNKSLPLVLVCATGARAAKAMALLQKAGYEKAVVLAGGTAAWREANLPVEKSA